VGAGTFLPVKTEVLSAHEMHRERYMMPSATLNAILQAKKEKRKIILVGTTSLRCVESFYVQAGKNEEAMQDLADRWWDTQLFIYPRQRDDRYQPWVGDALFTNFHQPCSTLYMLVSALLGYDTVAQVYRHALAEGYRFLSYGDASLLELPKAPSSL
jgi:S-adenosylmethionine:tRNA ribosyltransferase-isomerase